MVADLRRKLLSSHETRKWLGTTQVSKHANNTRQRTNATRANNALQHANIATQHEVQCNAMQHEMQCDMQMQHAHVALQDASGWAPLR